MLIIKTEATTESFSVNAASNSVYLAENEVDVSGDSMPTTKQQGHDTDPSTFFSTDQKSQNINPLHLTSTREDGTSKFSSPKHIDHNFIPAANLSTKHQNNNKELLSIKQHTENTYLAARLSRKLAIYKNNSSANTSVKQHNHDADVSVMMMKGHQGFSSNQLIQKSTKQQTSGMDTDPLVQLSTKQQTFHDDPLTLESTKEKDSATLKVNSESDPVTALITKSNVDSLNEFTAKPSLTYSKNFDTTKSASTHKKVQSNTAPFSTQGN